MLHNLRHAFAYLFRRRRVEDDLDEELRSSFDMLVEQFVSRGMSPVEARRAARLEFEGLEQVKESVRDGLLGSAVETFFQDVRQAWRGLRRRPSFAAIALVTLALGIGVNTAVFSVFYAVLLRPLPYRNPERLARVRTMTEYVARDIAPAGFTAVLAAIFGGLALLLAATGIYGVLNYQVSRRLPEMGIRMALGAGAGDVLRLILREGLGLAAAGVLLGAAAALGAARWLGTLLYGVSAQDPVSYGFALVLLPAAALLGCWRPAWRAAGANPADIIREE